MKKLIIDFKNSLFRTTRKYKVEIFTFLMLVLLLYLWFKIDPESFSSQIQPIIGTLFASLFGAYFAFRINAWGNLDDKNKNEARLINKVINTLYCQAQIVFLINDYINKDDYVFYQAFHMPLRNYRDPHLKVNIDDIGFLLDHDLSILSELYKVQRDFEEMFDFIDRYIVFYSSKIEPVLIENDMMHKFSPDFIKENFHDDVKCKAVSDMDYIKTIVENNFSSLPRISSDICDLAISVYPGFKFIKFARKET
ncbi:hypothetical protein [Vibrio anguillarum]|uniref:hypothetical protein n=1 Tax=Vibrio anguillarum TaxID=55601 RepID=UPI00097E1D77|nr:hypothetical protein [Vibrio anguillarum]AQM20570.1 hypothetical protein PN51_12575 [Vibrio anguillarum]AUB88925.1 hypothetical protein CKY00_16965 [Vibrio anguillarum]AUB92365.1 hypothetical protein CKX99_16980 [Vibrio anguillarum]AUB95800.1 hypothetical protein CK210_16970 [Vibrio anguillarum]AUB99221.1 hypothetical protein CK209_16895 [Vibrio anguillarum]